MSLHVSRGPWCGGVRPAAAGPPRARAGMRCLSFRTEPGLSCPEGGGDEPNPFLVFLLRCHVSQGVQKLPDRPTPPFPRVHPKARARTESPPPRFHVRIFLPNFASARRLPYAFDTLYRFHGQTSSFALFVVLRCANPIRPRCSSARSSTSTLWMCRRGGIPPSTM